MSEIAQLRCGLAPMEGVTDFATRLWFQLIGGMDFTWTPFLRVTDTFPSKLPESFAPEVTHLRGLFKASLIFQVMGSRPDDVVRTAEILGNRVDFIDLNCGCPSPTVVGSRAGSSLLERVDLFSSFIESVAKRVGPGRLSVKMRTGFHSPNEFPELLGAIKGYPLRQLTVHGRTRPDRYTGQASWELIELAAKSCVFPVIGSGDICDKEALVSRNEISPSVDGVIIGRGALRNPWIFRDQAEAPVLMALVAFIALQELGLSASDKLVQLAEKTAGRQLSHEGEFWGLVQSVAEQLGQTPQRPTDLVVSARALSRGKMLWNYLRSSLPDPFMAPAVMRSSTLSDLILGIESIARQNEMTLASLELRYRREHDWMYSGAGRSHKVPDLIVAKL